MSSPSPFPPSCRPTPLVAPFFFPPTTFTEDSHPAYFFFSLIGYAAFQESGDLCAAFRRKYPVAQRSHVGDTPEFRRDRVCHLASLGHFSTTYAQHQTHGNSQAAVYAVAGIRDLIHENTIKAARADIDAALELMTNVFVGAWGPSVSTAARARREMGRLRAARRRQREEFWAARAAALEAASSAHERSLTPVPLPAQWDTVTAGWGDTGTANSWGTGSGWGAATANNNEWGTGSGWGAATEWGWGHNYRRRQPAPIVWPLRLWTQPIGRTACPSTRAPRRCYMHRRRRHRIPPTWDTAVGRLTALIRRVGKNILARGLLQ
ncbi:hypothetical protein C8F04DRAFT_1276297 [Mycena alexandri]|uniref:Uncharacterized protein n=1 Tax=Mycena alexandri TaxID=1745969 RepID=A0AAD6WPY7_9AGAR|nr:hypothetical protein C8F04DRAFT_1276297 [Mycena alexandri]